jgi:hypothetical protein
MVMIITTIIILFNYSIIQKTIITTVYWLSIAYLASLASLASLAVARATVARAKVARYSGLQMACACFFFISEKETRQRLRGFEQR